MNAISTLWQQREQYELDGVRYEVSGFASGDGLYSATWFCSRCKEKEAWSSINAKAPEIIRQAELGVRVHHELIHNVMRPSRPRVRRRAVRL
jgi:hypothetical protein